MIHVLLVDDHPILRRGLKDLLLREIEDVDCGEAHDASEVLTAIQDPKWDLVILDITMPGRSGLDVLQDIKAVRPRLPVLILSMHPEEHYAKRVLRAGASGYMNKETAPDELVTAVRKLVAGGRYVSGSLAELLARDLGEDPRRPLHEGLSDREFEVLRMLASGKTVTRISEELHLSVTTVSTYRARLLEKLNLTSTASLIQYAIVNHLVE